MRWPLGELVHEDGSIPRGVHRTAALPEPCFLKGASCGGVVWVGVDADGANTTTYQLLDVLPDYACAMARANHVEFADIDVQAARGRG